MFESDTILFLRRMIIMLSVLIFDWATFFEFLKRLKPFPSCTLSAVQVGQAYETGFACIVDTCIAAEQLQAADKLLVPAAELDSFYVETFLTGAGRQFGIKCVALS